MLKKRYHQTGVRIEEDLFQILRQQAHEEWRTLSSQINISLRAGLKKPKIEEVHEDVKNIMLTQTKILSILENTPNNQKRM